MEKSELISLVNKIFSFSTVLAFILSVFLFLMAISRKKIFLKGKIIFLFPLLISFLATSGSLFYSEIAGYEPCKLCWFQRIFMYPQLILFFVAYLINDKKVFNYSLVLSSMGFFISFYHYFLQFGIISGGVCPVVGYSVSCVKKFTAELGFITIPLMAASAFLLLTSYAVFMIKSSKNENED